MPIPILVATPHRAFGELIRLSLNEDKRYQAHVAATAQLARDALEQSPTRLCILDSALTDEPVESLFRGLSERYADMRLVIIPPDNNPNHPSLAGLTPNGFLNRPFYLPDLMDLVERLTGEPAKAALKPNGAASGAGGEPTWPSWLDNPLLLESCLEDQVTGSEVLAAIVIRGSAIHACAGALPSDAAQELADAMLKHWDHKEQSDLMRYVRLSAVKGDLLAYATHIAGDLLLILVYEPGLSVRLVRPLTRQIAQTLSGDQLLSADGRPVLQEPPSSEPRPAGARGAENNRSMGSADHPPTGQEGKLAEAPAPADDFNQRVSALRELGRDEMEDEPASEAVDDARIDLFALLGGAIPAPDPGGEPVVEAPPSSASQNSWGSSEWTFENPREAPAAELLKESAPEPDEPSSNDEDEGAYEVSIQPVTLEDTPAEAKDVSSPRVISTVNQIHQLEPVSPALSLLNYTCVLIPRLPQHYLTGELADRLAQWVQHMCVAYGWRLDGISIRPEYLQWSVQVTPTVSPGNLVRVIRQHTSTYIFETFDYLKQQNPSGDFWALGYLIVSGSQPPSAQLLREYIQKTRKRQGISKLST